MKQHLKNIKSGGLQCAFMIFFVGFSLLAQAQSGAYQVETSSYIGDGGSTDVLNAARIQSNGNIVLAVNNTNATIGGVNATTLNGASSSSAGTIVRLNSTGTTVLSVTKVSVTVLDLALDASDNIYIALGTGGIVKLNATASSVTYQKANGGNCRRIDVGSNGTVVGLNNSGEDTGKFYVYDASGADLYNSDGKNFTQDVAINDALQLVYYIGFRNANSGCNPVQVCYIIAKNFSGAEVWRDYDWAANLLDDCDGTSRENNMADTRGYRIAMGEDGKLYAAFESAGGNHIFRYSPHNLTSPVTVVGGDAYSEWYNTRDEHKTFFARFDASNGDYLLGQQFVSRPVGPSGLGNAIRIKDGDISADTQGRVYLGGNATDGIPLTFDTPEPGNGTGGAFLMAVSPDFKTRLFLSRVSNSKTRSFSVRTVSGQTKAVFGGEVSAGKLYLRNPIQSTPAGGTQDANFGVLKFAAGKSNPTVSITAPADGTNAFEGSTITINADASDSDGSIAKVDFFRDDVFLGTDTNSPYSYTINNAPNGSFVLRARATDNEGFETYSPRVTVNISVNAENLVLKKSLTYSSQQTGNEASKAIDGDIATRWAATPFPQWIEIDMGSVKDINRTEMVCYGDRAYQYKVEVKTTGEYTTVVDRTANTQAGTGSKPITDIFTITQARYVKLTVTGEANNASGWVGVAEFRVYNSNSTSPANVSPTVNITSPANNATFTAGSNLTINADATDSDGTIAKVEFYQGSTKLGESTSSPYSYTWSSVVTGTYALKAIATDNKGASTTSSIINITVGAAPTAYAIPGKIEAENFTAMSGVQTENTSDTGGGQNVGYIDTGDWMDYSVNVASAGTYTINYRVASQAGGGKITLRKGTTDYHTVDVPSTGGWQTYTTVSAGATLVAGTQTLRIYAVASGFNINWFEGVSGSVNEIPTVNITSPVNNATFTSGSSITINANASDPDGSVSKVEFYQGSTKLGEDTSSPYSFNWAPATTGSYALTAKAIDNGGASTTSAIVTIQVNAPASGALVYAINAGGSGFTATDGTVYSADTKFSGGNTASTSAAISNTTDETLYQTERYGNVTYALPVSTSGDYDVTLKFAETYQNGAGNRSFDVKAEGVTIISALDIFVAAGGKNIAYDVPKTINVTDGVLTLEFITKIDNAKISAILVKNSAVVRMSTLEEESDHEALMVHPNPATNTLYITAKDVKSVVLYNIQGVAVIQPTGNYQTVDISGIPAGMYLLKIKTSKAVHTRKVLKQ